MLRVRFFHSCSSFSTSSYLLPLKSSSAVSCFLRALYVFSGGKSGGLGGGGVGRRGDMFSIVPDGWYFVIISTAFLPPAQLIAENALVTLKICTVSCEDADGHQHAVEVT